jgi:N-acylglucosamine 2-epimerase
MKTKEVTLAGLADILEDEMARHIMPFWRRHGSDPEHDGLLNCIDETGNVLSTEKFIWSQTRGLWTFSTMARRDGHPDDRRLADSLYRFCVKHGRNERGEWVYRTTREGQALPNPPSISTDGFALMGLTAYYELTANEECWALLRSTADSVMARLAVPGSYDIFPYQLPAGVKCHGIAMLFSLALWDAGTVLQDPAMLKQSVAFADDILANFVSPADHAVLEFIQLDNSRIDGPLGRVCLPGHTMESMWALIRVYRAAGQPEKLARCVEIIRWHMELGWDKEFGGVYLAIDLDGNTPAWRYPDYKPWWTSVETMYALLLAYQVGGEAWCLEWYERVHNYAFSHYPVRPDGEWRNRLNRQGEHTADIIGLPVKDPFHLPRALLYSIDALREMGRKPGMVNVMAGA